MIESIKILDKELLEVKKAALASTLKPLPGETVFIIDILIFINSVKAFSFSNHSVVNLFSNNVTLNCCVLNFLQTILINVI